jgi:hypothetical protein
MAILQCTNSIVGTVGVVPNFVFINTNDTPATVTTAGYLNQVVHEGLLSVSNTDLAFVSTKTPAVTGPSAVLVLQVSITGVAPNQVYSLVAPTTSGGSIFAGNVQAGINGTAGAFLSYPATLNTGHLVLAAASNAGNTVNTITNASQAGTRTFTIPDPGVTTTKFLLTDNAATQTIATGSLALTVGTLTLGSSNHASSLTIFPPTAASGFFEILPIAAGGAFNTIISNAAIGQTTTYTIPDAANATARFLVGATATPFTANHSLVASGTGGLIADAGYQMKTVAQAAVAGGAAGQTVTDAFCTTGSMVTASWNDTSNPVTIQTVAAGNGSFVVTSSGDPGASHLNYIITKV